MTSPMEPGPARTITMPTLQHQRRLGRVGASQRRSNLRSSMASRSMSHCHPMRSASPPTRSQKYRNLARSSRLHLATYRTSSSGRGGFSVLVGRAISDGFVSVATGIGNSIATAGCNGNKKQLTCKKPYASINAINASALESAADGSGSGGKPQERSICLYQL
jgi:hypothetical protein